MLISHEWLRAFVAHDLPPEALRDLISAHVATVDRMARLRSDLAQVVVARVVEAGPHPDSDHLWVTKVDDGSGTLLDVVCGAPNVVAGTLYPFARAGTTLPGGLKLERRKIRGQVSNGMLCSPRELALGDDHQGIMALDVDVAPGTPFLEALPIGDVVYEIDVLPNRPDLLCHRGMAREVSALTGIPVRMPAELPNAPTLPPATPPATSDSRSGATGGVRVRLDDADGCPRYMGVAIRGITVAESPEWLKKRVESVGLRPISNVVDATNYFLWAFGQPMHAFDLATLGGSSVIVRRASAGEPLVTLDGVERRLDPAMTVIADAERAIAIAGVMGGRDTEVTPRTTDVFLEVATFDGRSVRRTRRALGMATDASDRFERGTDPRALPELLAAAAALIVDLAGGAVAEPVDLGPAPPEPSTVLLRPARVTQLLGDAVEPREIVRLLESVGFTTAPVASDRIRVTAPSWRNDVFGESDLVEEIARLRGYDVLSDEVKPFRPSAVPDHPLYVTGIRVRDALVGDGLSEVRPLPFVRGADDTHRRVQNPLAEDEPHLRVSLLETLARRAEHNLSRMIGDIRMFEIGAAFGPSSGALPDEDLRASAVIMGRRRPRHFTEPDPPEIDQWDAKALAERMAHLAFPGEPVALEPGVDPVLWTIRVGEAEKRTVGSATRLTLDAPPWASPAFGVEVILGPMPNAPVSPPGHHAEPVHDAAAAARQARHVAPLPTTPAATFDLALLLPDGGDGPRAADVERVLRSSAGDLLERLELFDEYRGEGVPPGFRSVAWTLTFRDPSRTLRDKEIEGRRQKILKTLEHELGVRQRTS